MAQENLEATNTANKQSISRVAFSAVIGILVVIYIMGIVLGYIPKERQISGSSLAVILIAVLTIIFLLKPSTFDRLKLVETRAFKLELFEVKQKLEEQGSELQDIATMLPLLLPNAERKHLLNLEEGKAKYQGQSILRAELRHLRSIGLIRIQPGHRVGDLVDGLTFDLADYVKLTDLGTYWLKRIHQIEKQEPDEDVGTNEEISPS